MHIPTKPWYSLTKNFLNLKCPIAAAVSKTIKLKCFFIMILNISDESRDY